METEGINLDVLSPQKNINAEGNRHFRTKKYMKLRREIQPSITKTIGRYSFDKLKIGGAKQKKTKTGQYATGEEVLITLPMIRNARYSRMATNGKTTIYL
jgi:DNA polymerase-1